MSTATDIGKIYQDVLQREADPGGQAYWENQFAAGMSMDQIHTAIINSSEAQTNVAPIVEMYQAALGREADPGGLAYWVHQFESGQTLQQVAAGFADSPEAQALASGGVTAAYVAGLYANSLGREAAVWETNYWVSQGLSRGDVLFQIEQSAEAQARFSNHANMFLEDVADGKADFSGPLTFDDDTVINLSLAQTVYNGSANGETLFRALPDTSGGIAVNTIQSADVITGHGASNELQIQGILNAGTPPGGLTVAPTLSGVQSVEFVNSANNNLAAGVGLDIAFTLDLAKSTGVQEVDVVNSGNSNFVLLNAAQLGAVKLEGSAGATLTLSDPAGLNVTQAEVANSPAGANGNTVLTLTNEVASSLALTVDNSAPANGNFVQVNVTGLSATQGVHDLVLDVTSSSGATAAAPNELDLNVSGGPALNNLTINAAGNEAIDFAPFFVAGLNDAQSAAHIVVNSLGAPEGGAGSLDLTDLGLNHFDAAVSFNSTGYGGDLKVAVGGDAALATLDTGAGKDMVDLAGESTVTTGAVSLNLGGGDDTLAMGAWHPTGSTFDGGTGTNTLAAVDGTAMADVSNHFVNFQVLEIGPTANPTADNTAGLAGGTGAFDLAALPGLTSVDITAIDANSSLAGDVTLNNAAAGFSLDLVASGATTIADASEAELSGVAFSDGLHAITVNMAVPGDAMTLKLDAGAVGFNDSEGTAGTAIGGIVAGLISIHGAGAVTVDSTFTDYSPAGFTADPGVEIGNELGLALNDATALTVNASLSLNVDQADQVAPNLASITITGSGQDVDLAYNASAATAAEGGVVTPDVLLGIQAPLTLVDASGLKSITVVEGTTTTLQGGNFHAIFTDTAATPMTFIGAEQANLVTIHGIAAGSSITGGAADDYFAIDGAGGATFHYASAADARVNDGAAPEGGETGETGGTPEPGEATTTMAGIIDPTVAGSTSVPNPAALGEAKIESIFGFSAADTLDFSKFGAAAVVEKAVPFATTDVGAAIAGFFSSLGATHDVVVASDASAPNDVFVLFDANGDGNYDPTVDAAIHLHNDAGLTAATAAAHILIA